ncbi:MULTISPECIES: alpha/beta hydrolase [unclassified Modestobacter]|uniref:alpha/beta hydrolase n=1 Tax=unclassified Modestobacter TaxID=2643866 RepID=UPI0022AA52A8|nr:MULTISPECIES: alpha/beta hydrolase [unclassified Modestobacter]MCZ2826407.1 alpha/beta hydrolase [Modestobacter sp. VKM Ac-2981]MCZ2852528.1 alpha/beta hydrolase [Modestobacter sp. VKM Ac-2982]
MSTTETPEWAGPAHFLDPHEPIRRADGARHFSGLTYAVAFGYRPLQLDLWVPDTPAPAPLVVYVHGGGWMMGDRRYLPETLRPGSLFDAFLDAGLAVATIDYRHAHEAAFPAQLHDAKAAVRYLRAHADVLGVDTTRIGAMGESAGGHLAALLGLTAHRPDLEGRHGVTGPSSAVDVVVDWYGVADLDTMPRQAPPPEVAALLPVEMQVPPEDQLLDGLDGQLRDDASPISHVTADAPPFLLVHGTADWLVPCSQSEQLHAALTAVGVDSRLVPVKGAGHIWLGCDDVDGIVELSVKYLAEALA